MSQTDEPYTVVSIELMGEVKWRYDQRTKALVPAKPGTLRFTVVYRNYTRHNSITVHTKDELEAFMKAQKRLNETKNHYDKYGKKKKEQTNVYR